MKDFKLIDIRFYVLILSVFLNTMIIECSKHGKTKHLKRGDSTYRCGKCIICGYKKYSGALDFHHINPKTKSFALSAKGLCYSWTTVMDEAQKCVLLCKNCHAVSQKRGQVPFLFNLT